MTTIIILHDETDNESAIEIKIKIMMRFSAPEHTTRIVVWKVQPEDMLHMDQTLVLYLQQF